MYTHTHTHTHMCVCVCAQSCPTLWNPMVCNPPVSFVHGIFQARMLEGVTISFSKGSSWPRDRTHVSCIGRQIVYHLSHQRRPMYVCMNICLLLCCTQETGTTWSINYPSIKKKFKLVHFGKSISLDNSCDSHLPFLSPRLACWVEEESAQFGG